MPLQENSSGWHSSASGCACRAGRAIGPPGGLCSERGPLPPAHTPQPGAQTKSPRWSPARLGSFLSTVPVMGGAPPWWRYPCPCPSGPGVGSSGSESGLQSPGLFSSRMSGDRESQPGLYHCRGVTRGTVIVTMLVATVTVLQQCEVLPAQPGPVLGPWVPSLQPRAGPQPRRVPAPGRGGLGGAWRLCRAARAWGAGPADPFPLQPGAGWFCSSGP